MSFSYDASKRRWGEMRGAEPSCLSDQRVAAGVGAVGLIDARSPGGQDLSVVFKTIDVIFSTHLL